MKRFPLFLLMLCLGTAAFAQKMPKLKTWEDTLSYAIGLDVAKSLKKNHVTLNSKALAKGYDAQMADKPGFDDAQVQAIMQRFQANLQEAEMKAQEQALADNKAKGAAWLKENGTKEGVVTTPSGLQYRVLTQGTGPKPTLRNQVVAHYEGRLIDGTIFDSSYERGEPATFPLNGVIQGWQEGLQLMNVGSKYELFIPSNLGYGDQGMPPVIGPASVLVFVVELVEVK
jgi:FKBP-type peptidyl-prolyl cis-trans isomerase FklB